MAESTQDITTFAASQQDAAIVQRDATQAALDSAGHSAEIEVYNVATRYALNFRQPTGATLTPTQFEDLLKSLRLLKND